MFDDFYNKLAGDLKSELHNIEARLRLLIQANKDPERIAYNLDEAARLTGIGYDTLYARCKSGKIEYSQDGPGAAIIIKRQTLLDYVHNTCRATIPDRPEKHPEPDTSSPNSADESGHVVREIRMPGSSLQKVHRRKRLTGD